MKIFAPIHGFYVLMSCSGIFLLSFGFLLASQQAQKTPARVEPAGSQTHPANKSRRLHVAATCLMLTGVLIILLPAFLFEISSRSHCSRLPEIAEKNFTAYIETDHKPVSLYLVPIPAYGPLRETTSTRVQVKIPMITGYRYQAIFVVDGKIVDEIPVVAKGTDRKTLTLARDFVWQSPEEGSNQ